MKDILEDFNELIKNINKREQYLVEKENRTAEEELELKDIQALGRRLSHSMGTEVFPSARRSKQTSAEGDRRTLNHQNDHLERAQQAFETIKKIKDKNDQIFSSSNAFNNLNNFSENFYTHSENSSHINEKLEQNEPKAIPTPQENDGIFQRFNENLDQNINSSNKKNSTVPPKIPEFLTRPLSTKSKEESHSKVSPTTSPQTPKATENENISNNGVNEPKENQTISNDPSKSNESKKQQKASAIIRARKPKKNMRKRLILEIATLATSLVLLAVGLKHNPNLITSTKLTDPKANTIELPKTISDNVEHSNTDENLSKTSKNDSEETFEKLENIKESKTAKKDQKNDSFLEDENIQYMEYADTQTPSNNESESLVDLTSIDDDQNQALVSMDNNAQYMEYDDTQASLNNESESLVDFTSIDDDQNQALVSMDNNAQYMEYDDTQASLNNESESLVDFTSIDDNQNQALVSMTETDEWSNNLAELTDINQLETTNQIKVGSTVNIGTASIYTNYLDAYLDENPHTQYYKNAPQRLVLGVAIATQNGIERKYIYTPNVNQEIDRLINEGGEIVSILTANKDKYLMDYKEGSELSREEVAAYQEGWYNIKSVSTQNTKGIRR